jgi:ABC-type multidrug transport system fused ATPase/permease subunit
MIAHRASALRRADRIFELENGRIARCGTWEELNASG